MDTPPLNAGFEPFPTAKSSTSATLGTIEIVTSSDRVAARPTADFGSQDRMQQELLRQLQLQQELEQELENLEENNQQSTSSAHPTSSSSIAIPSTTSRVPSEDPTLRAKTSITAPSQAAHSHHQQQLATQQPSLHTSSLVATNVSLATPAASAVAAAVVKQEMAIGGSGSSASVSTLIGAVAIEKPVAASQHPPAATAPARPATGIRPVLQVKTEVKTDALGRKRVDVDDPNTPIQQVIAQLKQDLAEAQARKEADQSVMLRLARKESQVLDLKKQLVNYMTPKRETSVMNAYNPVVSDPLLIHAFRRQGREIQRLRDELDRERNACQVRPQDLPSHVALGLIQKLQSLQKENANLNQQLQEGGVANKWAVLSLCLAQGEEERSILNVVTAQAQRVVQELKDAQQTQQKLEVAIQQYTSRREKGGDGKSSKTGGGATKDGADSDVDMDDQPVAEPSTVKKASQRNSVASPMGSEGPGLVVSTAAPTPPKEVRKEKGDGEREKDRSKDKEKDKDRDRKDKSKRKERKGSNSPPPSKHHHHDNSPSRKERKKDSSSSKAAADSEQTQWNIGEQQHDRTSSSSKRTKN